MKSLIRDLPEHQGSSKEWNHTQRNRRTVGIARCHVWQQTNITSALAECSMSPRVGAGEWPPCSNTQQGSVRNYCNEMCPTGLLKQSLSVVQKHLHVHVWGWPLLEPAQLSRLHGMALGRAVNGGLWASWGSLQGGQLEIPTWALQTFCEGTILLAGSMLARAQGIHYCVTSISYLLVQLRCEMLNIK